MMNLVRVSLFALFLASIALGPTHAQTPPVTVFDRDWLSIHLRGGSGIQDPKYSDMQILVIPEGYLLKLLDVHGEHITFIPDPNHTWNNLATMPLGPKIFDGYFLYLNQPTVPVSSLPGTGLVIALNSVEYMEPVPTGSTGAIIHLRSGNKVTVTQDVDLILRSIGM